MTSQLAALADLASQVPAPDIRDEAASLDARYASRELCVACLGQFKRGKSTLINALIGTDLLPTGVLPVTAVPVLVRYGDPAVRIRRADGWTTASLDALQIIATDRRRSTEWSDVAAIEARYPAPILATGLCFLDTPGLGSVDDRHDAAALAELPRIDAALLVTGDDPPLSGAEIGLLRGLDPGITEVWLVLNKADRSTPQRLATAVEYATATVLRETGRTVTAAFCLSAEGATERRGDAEWSRFVTALGAMAASAGDRAFAAHVDRAVGRIAALLVQRLDAQIGLLEDPVRAAAEQAARLEALQRRINDLTNTAGLHLEHSIRALMRSIRDQRDAYLDRVVPAAQAELHDAVTQGIRNGSVAGATSADQIAIAVARPLADEWAAMVRNALDRGLGAIIGERQAEIESLRLTLAETAGVAVAAPPALSHRQGDAFARHYFHDLEGQFIPIHPGVRAAAALLPVRLAAPWIQRRAAIYLHELLRRNTTVAASDVDTWLHEVRRALDRTVHELLHTVAAAAEERAREAGVLRAAGEKAVASEVSRLRALRTAVHQAAGDAVAVATSR